MRKLLGISILLSTLGLSGVAIAAQPPGGGGGPPLPAQIRIDEVFLDFNVNRIIIRGANFDTGPLQLSVSSRK